VGELLPPRNKRLTLTRVCANCKWIAHAEEGTLWGCQRDGDDDEIEYAESGDLEQYWTTCDLWKNRDK